METSTLLCFKYFMISLLWLDFVFLFQWWVYYMHFHVDNTYSLEIMTLQSSPLHLLILSLWYLLCLSSDYSTVEYKNECFFFYCLY